MNEAETTSRRLHPNALPLPGYEFGGHASLEQLEVNDLIELTLNGETRPYRVTSKHEQEDPDDGEEMAVFGTPLNDRGQSVAFPRELLTSTPAHVVRRLNKVEN